MDSEDAAALLDRIAIFRHPCDLDLLLFFVAHPRTLLTSEFLATYLGYELKQIAASLEILLAAGLLKRSQTQAHAARLYVFEKDSTHDERLRPLLEIASTRQGRAALRRILAQRSSEKEDSPSAEHHNGLAKDRSRSLLVRSNQRSRRRGGL